MSFVYFHVTSEKSAYLWDDVRFVGPFVGSAQLRDHTSCELYKYMKKKCTDLYMGKPVFVVSDQVPIEAVLTSTHTLCITAKKENNIPL